MGVRQLEQWGAVEKVWVKGDRKDYYKARETIGRIIKNALVDLAGKRIQGSSSLLDDVDRLAREAWKLMPAKTRRHLGKTPPFLLRIIDTSLETGNTDGANEAALKEVARFLEEEMLEESGVEG